MKWNPTDVACDIARLSDFLYKRHIFFDVFKHTKTTKCMINTHKCFFEGGKMS